MLNVCNNFSDENGVHFNAIKTVCIKYHSKCHPQGPVKQFSVSLSGTKLKWFDCVKHLGHKLNFCLKSTHCIKYRRWQFIGVVNQIQTEFSFAHPECKCQMLKIYGCSFYGSPLWDLYSTDINCLYTSWNVAFITICGLPYRTHTRYLEYVSGLLYVKHILKCRFIKFIQNMMQGNNKHLQYVLKMCALENCLSPSGLNLKRNKEEYYLSVSELILRPHNMIRHKMHTQYNDCNVIPSEEWIISVILELMDCKRGWEPVDLTTTWFVVCLKVCV